MTPAIAKKVLHLFKSNVSSPPSSAQYGLTQQEVKVLQLLVDGMSYIEENAALVIIPGLALTAVVVSFNLLGEAFALQKVPRAVRGRLLARKKATRAVEEAARKEVEA